MSAIGVRNKGTSYPSSFGLTFQLTKVVLAMPCLGSPPSIKKEGSKDGREVYNYPNPRQMKWTLFPPHNTRIKHTQLCRHWVCGT